MFNGLLTSLSIIPAWLLTLLISLAQPLVLTILLAIVLAPLTASTLNRFLPKGRSRKARLRRFIFPLTVTTLLAPVLSFSLFWLGQFMVSSAAPARTETTALRIAHLNTWRLSSFISPKAKFIETSHADVISIVEVNALLARDLSRFKKQYPYTALSAPAPTTGLYEARLYPNALLSRWPIATLRTWGERTTLFRIDRPDAPFYLLQVHPRSPLRPEHLLERNGVLQQLGLAQLPSPLIVVGDFNTVPWDPALNTLKRNSSLPGDLTVQGSWWPTFHSRWPLVPIDLLLSTPDFGHARVHRQQVVDTDHTAVIFDFPAL